ncbi:tyrosine-type recombinase/integrase [Halothiobacillus sp.]|uniref:tyrosine-type recombinase/integrase n=1 Tax=Halothiobacillus sp. TaxID=1891311 RepID=UPI002AD43354|nr:tyrosine-type recombinase/integrase [Halothiobacillus sp.]
MPANLYEPRKGYFVYRNPKTGKTHALGRIAKREAIAQAIEANHYIEVDQAVRIIERIHAEANGELFGAWLDRFETILSRRKLAENTQRTNRSRLKAIRAEFGTELIHDLEGNVRRWADWFESIIAEGKNRSAVAFRSILVDCWREAIAAGVAQRNPIEITKLPGAVVQRDRLTLDAFRLIHAAALTMTDPWIARSMELAIVTAQRREDIHAMQFRPSASATAWASSDGLFVHQQKTGKKLIIPLDLGLDAVGMSITDVIDSCRASHIATPWMLHHTRNFGTCSRGDPAHIDTISRSFMRARDLAVNTHGKPLWDPAKKPPTFHELRSLSIRLYTDQINADFAQALAGHSSQEMTAVYRDVRGSEWVKVFKAT